MSNPRDCESVGAASRRNFLKLSTAAGAALAGAALAGEALAGEALAAPAVRLQAA
jgi:hypothetical protein